MIFGGMLSACSGPKENVTLFFYGVFDRTAAYTDLITQYEQMHPHIDIVYKKLGYHEYYPFLANQIKKQKPVDIFLQDGYWIEKNPEYLEPVPESWAKDADISKRYTQNLVQSTRNASGQVVAWPQSIDSMFVYYNKNMWQDIPNTYAKLRNEAEKWQGNNAPIALGSILNTDRGYDVLKALYEQSGNSDIPKNIRSLDRITAFNTIYPFREKWNPQRNYQLEEFAQQNVGAVLSYNYKYVQIHNTVNNDFPIWYSDFPKLEDGEKAYPGLAWYYSIGKDSPYKKEAWEFIKFLSKPKNEEHIYKQNYKIPASKQGQKQIQGSQNAVTQIILDQAPHNIYYQNREWEQKERKNYEEYVNNQ